MVRVVGTLRDKTQEKPINRHRLERCLVHVCDMLHAVNLASESIVLQHLVARAGRLSRFRGE